MQFEFTAWKGLSVFIYEQVRRHYAKRAWFHPHNCSFSDFDNNYGIKPCRGNVQRVKRPYIWVSDELSAIYLQQAVFGLTLTHAASRMLQCSFVARNVNERTINAPEFSIQHRCRFSSIGVTRFVKQERGEMLNLHSTGLLPKNQRYCRVFFISSCSDRWKKRIAWKLVPSIVLKMQKMRQAACNWEPRRGKGTVLFLIHKYLSLFFRVIEIRHWVEYTAQYHNNTVRICLYLISGVVTWTKHEMSKVQAFIKYIFCKNYIP